MARRASPSPSARLHQSTALLLAAFAVSHIHATIFVPEEIPSLLSVVYSNLPPIKKGTDSRLGVGFRLGPNADVQFQLELGPQTNTAQIGGGTTNAAGAAQKRHATPARGVGGGGGGGGEPKDWLNAWRLQMSPGYVPDDGGGGRQSATDGDPADAQSGDGISDAVAHLRQLYRPQPVAA